MESLLEDVRRRQSRVDKVGTMGWYAYPRNNTSALYIYCCRVKERNVNKRFLNSLVLQTLPRQASSRSGAHDGQDNRSSAETGERVKGHRERDREDGETERSRGRDHRSRHQSDVGREAVYHGRERSRSRERLARRTCPEDGRDSEHRRGGGVGGGKKSHSHSHRSNNMPRLDSIGRDNQKMKGKSISQTL